MDKVLARYSAEFTSNDPLCFMNLHSSLMTCNTEITVFRELLQNSDDAQADKAEIRFETGDFVPRDPDRRGIWKRDSGKNDLPDLRTALVCSLVLQVERRLATTFIYFKCEQVHQWTFKNNGMIFRDQDWDRLEQIGAYQWTHQLANEFTISMQLRGIQMQIL